jgi:hypothetical protein
MSENRRSFPAGAAVALAIIAAGIVAAALLPGSETVSVDDTASVEVPDDGTAVVTALRAPGGLAVFGVQLIDPTHRVEVRFRSDPGCAEMLSSGGEWPPAGSGCPGPPDLEGEIGSLGIGTDGRSLIGVTVVVDGSCYDSLETGVPWPPGPECTG